MRISNRHDVALALLLAIGNESKSIATISAATGSSISHLEQVARPLRRAGLIESIRGHTGGYSLTRPLNKITLGDVFKAIGTDTKRRSYGLFDEIHRRLKDVTINEFLAGRYLKNNGTG